MKQIDFGVETYVQICFYEKSCKIIFVKYSNINWHIRVGHYRQRLSLRGTVAEGFCDVSEILEQILKIIVKFVTQCPVLYSLKAEKIWTLK